MQVSVAQLIEDINKFKGRVETLRTEVKLSAYGERPDDPEALINRLKGMIALELSLKNALAVANETTFVEWDGKQISLRQARYMRDNYLGLANALASIAVLPPTKQVSVYLRDKDGKQYPAYENLAVKIDLREVDAVANEYSKAARELNALIQRANWTTIVEV